MVKKGQNARLAARLTGYKIDIKSETQARESGLLDDLELGYEQGFEGYAEEPFDSSAEEAGADENHAEEDGTAAFGDVDFAGNEAEEGLGEENYQEQ